MLPALTQQGVCSSAEPDALMEGAISRGFVSSWERCNAGRVGVPAWQQPPLQLGFDMSNMLPRPPI